MTDNLPTSSKSCFGKRGRRESTGYQKEKYQEEGELNSSLLVPNFASSSWQDWNQNGVKQAATPRKLAPRDGGHCFGSIHTTL